jgi:hypothetical protein
VLNNALIFTDPTGLSPNPVFTTLSNPYFSFSWQWHEFEDKKNECDTECRNSNQKELERRKEEKRKCFCDEIEYPIGKQAGKPAKEAKGAGADYLFNQMATKYRDPRLSMADRAAGLDSSREKTDAFEKAVSAARPVAADWLDRGSKVFIYGAGAVAFLPPPFDFPALPLAGIGVGMDLASDILNPQPLKITTDFVVDKATSRLPGGAAATGAAQAIKDIKNLTPIGSN